MFILHSNYELAYGVGLIASDGSLSKDGRHIIFTSKDKELVEHVKEIFSVAAEIKKKTRATEKEKKYYYIQWSRVELYKWFVSLGLMPNKSKKMTSLDIPEEFFADFLRGHFDGDGCFYAYRDKRWKSSYQFYFMFCSASLAHIHWLQARIQEYFRTEGHVTHDGKRTVHYLKFGKAASRVLISKLYADSTSYSLTRKQEKIHNALQLERKMQSA